ncbi:MAG: hypothetical protein IJ794_18315 [Lachnospiraceae bacterium]|nr:hypothetical protein [Lachnospiraceae bacterium]
MNGSGVNEVKNGLSWMGRHILIERDEIDPQKCSYGFPWKHDSTCYNFRMPKECVPADRIGEMLGGEGSKEIETAVIGCELENYGFLADMINLRQLYIYAGGKIKEIDFVENLVWLQQLYVGESHIGSLDSLVRLLTEKKRLMDQAEDAWERLGYSMEGIFIETDQEGLTKKTLKETGLYVSEIILRRSAGD